MFRLLLSALFLFVATVASAAPLNLVANGDFSAGHVGFSSDYDYRPDSAELDDLWDAGIYGIDDSADTRHPYWMTTGDHTTGNGFMMLVNGFTNSTSTVWRQEVAVEAGQMYHASAWGMNLCCNSLLPVPDDEFTGPTLAFWLDGAFLGAFPTDGPGVWQGFGYDFLALSSTAVLEIRNTATNYRGNDFALDDIGLTAAPEPASLLLMGTGLIGLARFARRRQKV